MKEDEKKEAPKKGIKKDINETGWQPEILSPSSEKNQPLPKAQSFADRLPQVHAMRKRKLTFRLLLLISTFTLVILITLYFLSPLSKLDKVTVKGTKEVPATRILKETDFQLKDSLWPQVFAKNKKATALVSREPRIKNAEISFVPLNQLAITVTEFETKGYLLKDKLYHPILENGVVLDETVEKITGTPALLEDFTKSDLILETLGQYQQLTSEIQQGISEIRYTGTADNLKQVTLTMKDGNTVIAQISTLASHLKKYPQVASQMTEKGIVDMEAGIFSYPYPKKDSTTDSTTDSAT